MIVRKWVPGVHPMIQVVPGVPNDIHIRAIWWPREYIKLCLQKLSCGEVGFMLGIIVLLKIDVLFLDLGVPETPKKVIIEDFNVELHVHVANDAYKLHKTR